MDFLVINISLSMAGLNLHKACSRGILLQYAWNYWAILQALGRLKRMDQKEIVTWYIVMCSGTYSMVMEDKMCRKIVPEILFTGRIPAWVTTPNLKTVIAYNILRLKVCHPFNRFVWLINPPGNIDNYHALVKSQLK
jgi:hypothetical protein